MWLLLLLLAPAATAAPRAPDLSWLSGYWLSCDGAVEVSETWSDRRAGTMVGISLAMERTRLFYEFARIGPSAAGIGFFAQPSGQKAIEFGLKEAGAQRVVFENLAHDFPQRVIYWREGRALRARIEGTLDGKSVAKDWRYAAAPLNARCGKRSETPL